MDRSRAQDTEDRCRQSRCPRVRQGDCDGRYRSAKSTKQLLPPLSPRITNPRGPHYFEPTKWTEKERRLPNAGNCQEEKARWHPAEWKKGTESKDSITGKFYYEIRCKGTQKIPHVQVFVGFFVIVVYLKYLFEKISKVDPPITPSMTTFVFHIKMIHTTFCQALMETATVVDKHIRTSHVNVIRCTKGRCIIC